MRKEDRRKKLDKLLEEARRELSELQDQEPVPPPDPEAKTPYLSLNQMDAIWRCLRTIYNNRPYMKEIHRPATVSASELVVRLRKMHYDCPSEECLRAARRTDYAELERAVLDEESDDSIPTRTAVNEMQLMRESTSVRRLVERLLLRTHKIDKDPSTTESFEEARMLAKDRRTTFTYRATNPPRAKRNTALLNGHLRSIMNRPDLRFKEKMGRICYNLLVSAHAADMHTYNTLIVAFDKAGLHGFADALVHSFFHERLLYPTPSTFVVILNHYKVTQNHGKFLRALACVSGVDVITGGKVRRRHWADVEKTRGLLDWAIDVRLRTLSGDWVYEHVPPTLALVEAAICGLLHFKLFAQAASLCITCVRWGVWLSKKVVRQVLDECVVALDRRGALGLTRELMACKQVWKSMLLMGDGAADGQLASRIDALLDICGLRNAVSTACLANMDVSGPELGGLVEALEEHRTEPDRRGPRAATAAARAPEAGTRLLQLESCWKDYVAVRQTTNSIESKLLKDDFSIEFRTALALHIGEAAVQRAVQLRLEFQQLVGTMKIQ